MGGIPSWAVRGAKVVAVGSGPWESKIIFGLWREVEGPQPGEVCTISEVRRRNGGVELFLVEWPVANWLGVPEGYNIEHFRPLTSISETDETEAALFRKKGHRLTAPKPERANA